MSALRSEADKLRHARTDMREVHTGYDRILFGVVTMLVDEVEHLRGKLERLERTAPFANGSSRMSDQPKKINHPCPKGDDCALNDGARTCKHCGRNWPPDETWTDRQAALDNLTRLSQRLPGGYR